MSDPHLGFLVPLLFAAALLYSSVGHAGASGYLAAMSLFGLAPATMKPTALVLNIVVAVIATTRFWRAGLTDLRLFLWAALGSVPLAFLGGMVTVPPVLYRPLVGLVLLYSAGRLVQKTAEELPAPRPVGPLAPLLVGAAVGFLSGLTGVGGGIFLSPVLILAGWCDVRKASGVSAAFILVNSISGLLGNVSSTRMLPGAGFLACALAAVVLGGLLGSTWGSTRLPKPVLRRLLALVLVIAGLKMLLVQF